MPLRHGDLSCDQQGALVVAIVDNLEQIAALVGGERFGSPIIEDEDIDALERGGQRARRPSPRAWARSANRRDVRLQRTEKPSRQALLPSA